MINDFADKYFLGGANGWIFWADIFNESVFCAVVVTEEKKQMATNDAEMAVEKAFIGFQDT